MARRMPARSAAGRSLVGQQIASVIVDLAGACLRTGGHAIRKAVLEGFTIQIEIGERIALVCGSSEVREAILALLSMQSLPAEGRFLFKGIDVVPLAESRLSQLRVGDVGVVSPLLPLLPDFSVSENVCLPLMYGGANPKTRTIRSEQVLLALGLGARADDSPSCLDSSEMGRALLARAAVGGPLLLLIDITGFSLRRNELSEALEAVSNFLDRDAAIVLLSSSDEALPEGFVAKYVEDHVG